jgi:hypothetical protein
MTSFTLTAAVRAPAPASCLALDESWRHAQRHQPFFCEENALLLVRDASGLPGPRAAVFITNERGVVPMWGQRAAEVDPILWDYHVVVLLPALGVIVDLDDRASVAWPVASWLTHAFRPLADPSLAPRFRIVDAPDLERTFSSDRRHMRDDGGKPLRPFPPWPAPFRADLGATLPRFLDVHDDIAGVVVDADGLLALCGLLAAEGPADD